MGSTISAARAALFALLDAETGAGGSLEGVQVTFGRPDVPEQESVRLLGVTSDESEAALGAGRNEERYGIELFVVALEPGGDPDVVDARGWALADAVRAVVEANPRLDATVRHAQVTSTRSEGVLELVDESQSRRHGWVIVVELTVGCTARLT